MSTNAGADNNSVITEMMNFLKKYSAVDNAFVDDFFGQVDPSSADDDHTVDLDFVASWLGVRKGNLFKTLKASYQTGIDYVVTKPQSVSQGRGSNTRRIVMMTPDCFKTLCMQSRSPQADKVRAYFIAVEKTLFRFRLEIVESMRQRIKQLENNQRPLDPTLKRVGLVYVIRAADHVTLQRLGRLRAAGYSVERIKMGYTSDFSKRKGSHGSARADALEVLFTYKTDDMVAVEACAKGVLKGSQYRKYKEVYEADMSVIEAAIKGCGRLVTKIQRPIPRKATATKGGGFPLSFMLFSPL